MRFYFCALCVLLTTELVLSQTNKQLNWSVGWSASRSFGNINGTNEFKAHAYSKIETHSRWSTSWLSKHNNANLPFMEDFLRCGILSLRAETVSTRRISFASGLEIGGRYFDVIEYPLSGRDWEDKIDHPIVANLAHRNYLVASMPLLVKYKMPLGKFAIYGVTALFINHSFSAKQETFFYRTSGEGYLFPTAHLGIEVAQSNNTGLIFELGYQQGFRSSVRDQAVLYSAYLVQNTLMTLEVNSRGSHFRVGLRYAFLTDRERHSNLNKGYSNRGISETLRLSTHRDTIDLCLFDRNEDNDSVLIVSKNSGFHTEFVLKNEMQCVRLVLEDADENIFYIHAINEGDAPPNTMMAQYTDDNGKLHVYRFSTSLTKSIKIRIKYEK